MSNEQDSRPLITPERLRELEALASYARQRYDLYKARAYGPHLTSPTRMRELERECTRAEATLRFALAEAKRSAAPGSGS
ncbi:MAG TPA: hypothetical protein VG325_09760 [Solirubrobacteraceae bacterium]|nr:hypothetical protein [Solirubrobacteraceae bacterium]